MNFKDIVIVFLVIIIICTVLFGSLGNFLGAIDGVLSGVSNKVSDSEGYVYKGGLISDDAVASNTQTKLGSASSSGNASSSVAGSSSSGSSGSSSGSGSSSSSGSSGSSSGSGSSGSSSHVTYEDYQRDYETDLVDSEGNPIYLSIVSTSGGEMDPGIYQVYWSALGPINQTRIGWLNLFFLFFIICFF